MPCQELCTFIIPNFQYTKFVPGGGCGWRRVGFSPAGAKLFLFPPKVVVFVRVRVVALVLDVLALVKAPAQARPLLDVAKLGAVAHVARRPAGPVDVAALAALPVLSRKQPTQDKTNDEFPLEQIKR